MGDITDETRGANRNPDRTPKMTRRKFLKYSGLGALGLIGAATWFTRSHAGNPYYTGPVSDHFDGRHFFNPDGTPPRELRDLLKWQFNGKRAKWPKSWDSAHHGAKPAARVSGDTIVITHVGHATFLIQVNGLNLVTDPVWSLRASPVSFAGPKRVNPPGIAFDDLPQIDAVLLTHNHYDHLDIATLERLVTRDDPQILTPLGNDTIILNAIPAARTVAADWGEVRQLAKSTKIHFDPCHHWGARGMRDRHMALWCAFTIETAGVKIHHVGDTGFHDGINFTRARDTHGSFDVAILPIGAYEPRWFMKGQHMNPQEAVESFKLLNARSAIGHHWGTFQLTDEPIEEPREQLAEALAAGSIDPQNFIASLPGQVWTNRPNLA